MGTRTVTGTVFHLDGTPWASGKVKFELLKAFETSTEVYPVETHIETLDVNGQFSITLGIPDTGTAYYKVETPDGLTYKFYLAAGAPTTLETLLTIAGSPIDQNALQTLIDTHTSGYHLPSYYTSLSALTAPTADDILLIIDAPGGTPAIKKVTI